MRIIDSEATNSPPIFTFNLQCGWAASEYHSFNFPMNIQTRLGCSVQDTTPEGLMGREIYFGTIWAALAFKLWSGREMGNNNCIKIKESPTDHHSENWPRVLAMTGHCCTVGSPAVIRMWEQAVPTHWAHQAVSDMICVDNDNREMKRWSKKSAHVQTFTLPNKSVCALSRGGISFTSSFKVNINKIEQNLIPGDGVIFAQLLCVPEVSKLPAIWEGR